MASLQLQLLTAAAQCDITPMSRAWQALGNDKQYDYRPSTTVTCIIYQMKGSCIAGARPCGCTFSDLHACEMNVHCPFTRPQQRLSFSTT
jgi:hypothetical protein